MLIPFWSAETRIIDILIFYGLIVALGVLAYDTRLNTSGGCSCTA